MADSIHLSIHINSDQQSTYFTLPFQVPLGVESLQLRYRYPRRPENQIAIDYGVFTSQAEQNIIDLGLIDPSGRQVGASGSDKTEIEISETSATPGITPAPSIPASGKS